jgi:hypothetical protein
MSDWEAMGRWSQLAAGKRESVLEIGLVLLGLGVAAGVGFWLVSNASGRVQTGRRHAKGAPRQGSVPPARHAHTTVVAAR